MRYDRSTMINESFYTPHKRADINRLGKGAYSLCQYYQLLQYTNGIEAAFPEAVTDLIVCCSICGTGDYNSHILFVTVICSQ